MRSRLWSAFASANISIMSILTTAYFMYTFHQPIHRFVMNVTHNDIQPEQGHFRDPYGLRVYGVINDEGKRETYLVHVPSKNSIALTDDMFPETGSMLEKILHRSESIEGNEARQYIRQIHDIQRLLYERLGEKIDQYEKK